MFRHPPERFGAPTVPTFGTGDSTHVDAMPVSETAFDSRIIQDR